MMAPIIQALEQDGYRELAQYSFKELVVPLQKGLKSRNIYVKLFMLTILAGCICIGACTACWLLKGTLSGGQIAGYLLLGIPATLLLVPLHEGIHGLLFRLYGAKDVRYGVIWRKLMFYAVAHGFVVKESQFRYIALAPYVVISLLLALIFPFVTAAWQAVIMGVYCFHTLCCIGDFGLCAYFHRFRAYKPVSFDDANAGISYFYALPVLDEEKA